MRPHVLCIGGEDHGLRIPFLLALWDCGFRMSAAGTGDPTPFAQAGLDYHRFHFDRFFNPLADWAAFKAISKLIADVRPGLVQCFDTKLNLLVPLAARGVRDVRIVSTINGLGWLYSSRSLPALAYRPIWRALQWSVARSTVMTVFQNRDDQTFFQRGRLIGRAGSRLIPGSGIDVVGFEQAMAAGPSPAVLRQALGLGTAEVVLTVSRMTREKGIPTLLEAAAMVKEARPGVRFLLVGPRENEGPAALTQAEIDRHAPYVSAIGPRSDIPALLGLADVFAFPTEYREGVPRVLLEAALAGLPIVTTNLPGCSDVVRDGSTGLMVPTRAPKVLAGRIIELLRDRENARAMGARARELVRQEFSLGLVVARYAALYAELVDRSTQGDLRAMCDHDREVYS
jgi:glycosyltransferase involved in cell wall biosynthesis